MFNKFFSYLRPADVIALVVLIFGFTLLLRGVNGVVAGIVIAVVAYYFAGAKNRDYKKDS